MKPAMHREIRDSAIRIAIRLALGEFHIRGPLDNIMELESRVAWATVATELLHEGYVMVPPGEYAQAYGLAPEVIDAMIDGDGTLFALVYTSAGGTFLVVPQAERTTGRQLGPVPE